MGSAFLMAIALSLDGFGVGLTYGLRRIRIPVGSLLVIAFCTVVAMGVSMLFGHWVMFWLKFFPAQMVGALILLGLGSFQLLQALRRSKQGSAGDSGESESGLSEEETVPAMASSTIVMSDGPLRMEPILRINLHFLGLVIQVLRTPALADVDHSGGISLYESVLLGSALAMDAFASGIGAALAGMSLSVIVIVALTQLGMLRLGQELAGKIPEVLLEKADFLPGAVLILVGLGKLL
ncbi:MAG: manganese efflux pump [Desulfitobacteriaceae bacterium]